MLIPSHRHTKEDLALWRDLEAADGMHEVKGDLLNQSLEILEDVIRAGDCCAYTSWGKESVLLCWLLAILKAEIPVVYVRRGQQDNPDCELVRDAFLAQNPLNYYERDFDNEAHATNAHWRSVAKEFGKRSITGIRADESSKRMLSVFRHGITTENVCRPLGFWKLPDVFAMLAQRGLPVHPAYACLGGGRYPREHLRTHSIGGKSGSGIGRSEWEKEYYPEVFYRARAQA